MARRKVIHEPGALHFVTFSTYQRRRFLAADRANKIVLENLEELLHAQKGKCSGFVIMPNHVHAILFGDENFNMSRFLQLWKKTSSYRVAQFYREHMKHYSELCPKGCPVWQARFYDSNIYTDEELNLRLDYIHTNPVAAGLVDFAAEWLWSSARFMSLELALA
jgi:putative transposase